MCVGSDCLSEKQFFRAFVLKCVGLCSDDPGFFRGKKRSLHEGGIRQTIVVQWVGTIAANSVSDDMFIFYDLMPTAAELAGLPSAQWPYTDGLSAVPIFEAARPGRATKLAASSPTANRFLYYGPALRPPDPFASAL